MNLKIAMPVIDGRLHDHFGEATHFAFVEADRQSRAIFRTQTIEAPPHEPGSFPRWLHEQGVQVLIVGSNGIGQRALDNLVHHGIEVRNGRSGESLAVLVAECLKGQLSPTRQGCDHQHGQANGLQAIMPHGCRLHLK